MQSAELASVAAPTMPLRINIAIPRTAGEVYRHLVAPLKRLPDFLIIGASKCGTTSLFTYLTDLPWVSGPFYKEVHFFSYRWHRGGWFYRSRFPLALREWLAARRAGTRALLGEASPSYLFYPYCAARASKLTPRAKIVVLLRNPVDRAYSAYHHSLHWGWEHLSFEEALDREEERLAASGYPADQADETDLLYSAAYHSYVRHGLYADQLRAWFAAFPREQVMVIQSCDFYADTDRVVHDVCDFLGTRWVGRPSYPIYNYERGASRYAPMKATTRRRLVEVFRPHNARLYELLGRSFDWDR